MAQRRVGVGGVGGVGCVGGVRDVAGFRSVCDVGGVGCVNGGGLGGTGVFAVVNAHAACTTPPLLDPNHECPKTLLNVCEV